MIIYLGGRLLANSSGLPESASGTGRPTPFVAKGNFSLFDLTPGGVCRANLVT